MSSSKRTTSSRVIHREWLEAVRALSPGSVDLVYVDPPFNTGVKQQGRRGLAASFEDSWPTTRAYVQWLRERVVATIPCLKQSGSFLLHVDYRVSHHARVILEETLGEACFVNHLIWSYGLGGSSPRTFARKHDDILLYCVDPKKYYFEVPKVKATSQRMRGMMKKATDVLDIPSLNNMARERTGYPTQKPLALLETLIGACAPVGGLVVDPCCGSGTTLVAAARLGRIGLGFDISPDAVAVTKKRLKTEVKLERAPELHQGGVCQGKESGT